VIKLRKVDKNTKHLRGRLVISGNEKLIFPSAEKIFLRKLEEKILESAKDFKHSGIKVEHFDLQIK
jgi:hypothetical protein